MRLKAHLFFFSGIGETRGDWESWSINGPVKKAHTCLTRTFEKWACSWTAIYIITGSNVELGQTTFRKRKKVWVGNTKYN